MFDPRTSSSDHEPLSSVVTDDEEVVAAIGRLISHFGGGTLIADASSDRHVLDAGNRPTAA